MPIQLNYAALSRTVFNPFAGQLITNQTLIITRKYYPFFIRLQQMDPSRTIPINLAK